MYRRLILFPPEHLQSEVKAIFLRSERLSDQILHAIFTQGMAEGEIIERPIDLYINSFYCLTDGLFIQRFYYEPEYYDQKFTMLGRYFGKAYVLNRPYKRAYYYARRN
ncbi:hypothetical protein AAAC51_31430 [Priestia megaterium]